MDVRCQYNRATEPLIACSTCGSLSLCHVYSVNTSYSESHSLLKVGVSVPGNALIKLAMLAEIGHHYYAPINVRPGLQG